MPRPGEGVVQEFKKAMFGASQHVVAFDNPQHGVAKVTLERHGNGKTPFKVQVEKEAPKPKAATKASPKTRAKERRGFQTFSEQTSEAAAGGDGSAVDRFREAIKAGDFATVQSLLTQVRADRCCPCVARAWRVVSRAPTCVSRDTGLWR
eukprot:COSAG05_NODE_2137_length_3497_cov_1.466451_3_plen_150_part_00